jgi:hypothetical protein
MRCTTTIMQADMKIKKCAETCQKDNLTNLRRNQSPEREILKMFMCECCWPFTCRLILKGMGVLYGRILWQGQNDWKQPPSHCYAKALDHWESMKTHFLSKFLLYIQAQRVLDTSQTDILFGTKNWSISQRFSITSEILYLMTGNYK